MQVKKSTVAPGSPPDKTFERQQQRNEPSLMDIIRSLEMHQNEKSFTLLDHNLPGGVRKSDIGAVVGVRLERKKDQLRPDRVQLAQKTAKNIRESLQSSLGCSQNSKNLPRYILHVIVTLASDGSRAGRFWASQFGVGHPKIGVLYLLYTQDGSCIIKAGRISPDNLLPSRFADTYDSEAGRNYLVDMMAPYVANHIILTLC